LPGTEISNQFRFTAGHPEIGSHILRKRKIEHIPVLSGTPIPRRDIDSQANQYAIVMLALFRPWDRSAINPLKSDGTSWADALSVLLESLPPDKISIIDHMQEQWECRLAADDFSAEYKTRQANFNSSHGAPSDADDTCDELANDLDWQLGQLEVENPDRPDHVFDPPDSDDLRPHTETCAARTQSATDAVIALAGTANFYHIPIPPPGISSLLDGSATESCDGNARYRASAAALLLAEEKAVALQRHATQGIFFHNQRVNPTTNLFQLSD
jgi:hypothetical protein